MGEKGDYPVANEVKQADLFRGLSTYTAVPADLQSINSPALIAGTDFHQMLQISLAPGDVLTAEPGTMVMMSGGLRPTVDTGGCGQGCTRCCCAGENLFRLVFENTTQQSQFLAIAAQGPGKVIPLPLSEWSGITLSSGVFLAAYGKDWKYELTTVGSCLTACCGGQGIFLPRLHGSGLAFISASGAVEVVDLSEGEEIIVDQANLVAFQKGVSFEVRSVGGCLVCCCAGMGLFNVVLKGPGKVIVESLPMQKLARALVSAAQKG